MQKELKQISSLSSKDIKDKLISRLRRKVLPSRILVEGAIQKAKEEGRAQAERQLPKSKLGTMILDIVLAIEKTKK